MSRRGRKPIPAELKRAAGDGVHDSGGRVIPDAPPANPNRPPRPDHLTPSAARAWDRVCDVLEELGVLSATDAEALATLAELLGVKHDAYAAMKDAAGKDGRIGTIVKQPNGWPGPHPQWNVYTKATTQANALLAEFGLTPSGRSRVKTAGSTEEADPFAELNGGADLA